jgi:hypothetical protein
MMPDLTTTQELHGHDFASATFNALSFRDGLRHVHRASFAASDLTLAKMSLFGTVELSEQSTHESAVVLRPDPETDLPTPSARARRDLGGWPGPRRRRSRRRGHDRQPR